MLQLKLLLSFLSFHIFFLRVQKNFEGKLVGADRAKDLAVLKVHYPFFLLKTLFVSINPYSFA